jgi:5-methylcytosine-specific restriction endonuclease McrA
MKFTKGYTPHNKGKKSPWTSERNKRDNRTRTREKHWNWKGGISKIDKSIRQMPEYKQWRSDCFERDNWTCQTCNIRGVYLTVHHIKSFVSILKEYKLKSTLEAIDCKELWDINNGVTLCENCHSLTDNYKGRAIVTK